MTQLETKARELNTLHHTQSITMSVVLPGMSTEGKRTDFSPLSEHDGLIERYKAKNLDGILEVGVS